MTVLTWNHASSVGVRVLDQQHGILLDTLNELGVAIASGAHATVLSEIVARLIDFTRRHFETEEILMERFEYPESEEHISEHKRMLAQIADAARAMQHGEPLHLRTLTGFLRKWFVSHIEGADHEYGEWLNRQGID
jgi:hemerythrin-like metal-binding protein